MDLFTRTLQESIQLYDSIPLFAFFCSSNPLSMKIIVTLPTASPFTTISKFVEDDLILLVLT